MIDLPSRQNPGTAANGVGIAETRMVSVGEISRLVVLTRRVMCDLESIRYAALAAGNERLALAAEGLQGLAKAELRVSERS